MASKIPVKAIPTNSKSRIPPIRVVLLSDTHASHRKLKLPSGHILIHCGDFTFYGKREDVCKLGRKIPDPSKPISEWKQGPSVFLGGADDFNKWLAEPTQKAFYHRVVVNGNHEKNQDWTDAAAKVVNNATFLKDSMACLEVNGIKVNIWGTDFYWPEHTDNARRVVDRLIKHGQSADIVVAHGPVAGQVDGGTGCPVLASAIKGGMLPRCSLFACGHVHRAHGISQAKTSNKSVMTYVNAANAGKKIDMAHKPVVLDIHKIAGQDRFTVQIVSHT